MKEQTQSHNDDRTLSVAAVAVTVLGCMSGVAYVAWRYHRKTVDKTNQLRAAERKGRIRAEIRLRELTKKHKFNMDANQSINKQVRSEADKMDLNMKCIGTIVSPFTKRMGTPRQGALATNARGYVQLITKNCHEETIDGMESYSHCWILFSFHANTNIDTKKAKVKPPRGGGVRVGQLATRSPHRPNNIGLSLVKVDRVDKINRRLYITALDLVNGTPVYDIKPYVPWDIAGFKGKFHEGLNIKVPSWVSQDDELQMVSFSSKAKDELFKHLTNGRLLPLYDKDDFELAQLAISEVLAQDPRGAKQRGIDINESYKLMFGLMEIEFIVANNEVYVKNVAAVDLSSHELVDGIPLFSQ